MISFSKIYTIISVILFFSEIGLQYVDSLNTTAHNEGWLVFNLTGPLTTWVAIPDLNLGLYLSVTPHGHPSKYHTLLLDH